MMITLGTSPYIPEEALLAVAQVIKALGGKQANKPEHLQTWYCNQAQARAESSEHRYLLVYTWPEAAVAQAVLKGETIDMAFESWRDHAEQMLQFYKLNRKQAALVQLTELSHAPEAALKRIANQLGVEPSADNIVHLINEPEAKTHYEQVLELFAREHIGQNPNNEKLIRQLEASSLPLGGQGYQKQKIDVLVLASGVIQQMDYTTSLEQRLAESETAKTDAQTHLARLTEEKADFEQALGKSQEEHKHTREECDLALAQLHQVQEEFEQQFQQIATTEQARKEAEKAHQGELEHLKRDQSASLAREQEASAKIEHSLKQTRAELATAQQRIQRQEQEASERQATLQQSQNTADSAEARARQVEADLTQAHSELAEMRDENDLVITQLLRVQEEIERLYWRNQELNTQVTRSQEQNATTHEALETANQQISQLNSKLERLKHSASWKATAPIRAIGKPFRRATPEQKNLKKQKALILESDLFNPDWYLNTYQDVANEGADPAEHFILYGAEEGRDPSPEFDTDWYLRLYPDVAEAGLNPLVHYLKFGKAEGRLPKAV